MGSHISKPRHVSYLAQPFSLLFFPCGTWPLSVVPAEAGGDYGDCLSFLWVYIAPPGRAERAAQEQIEEAATKKERASPAELLEDVLDGCLRHLQKLRPSGHFPQAGLPGAYSSIHLTISSLGYE